MLNKEKMDGLKVKLQKRFKVYLRENNPNLPDSTVNTYTTDSFYMYNNGLAEDFWRILFGEVSIEQAKILIANKLTERGAQENTIKTRTYDYYRVLNMLKEFVDTNYNQLENLIDEEVDKMEKNTVPKHPKNLILYGPPGTGKTYNAVNYAVAIIESKTIEEIAQEERRAILDRYNKYKDDGQIEFCTFHQSFGYEEFIEGIKPYIKDTEEISYKVEPGIFKSFCSRAITSNVDKSIRSEIRENPTVWKVALYGSGENYIRKDCMDNDRIRIGYGDDKELNEILEADSNTLDKSLNRMANEMQIGDIVISSYTSKEFDAIGVVTGEFDKNKEFTEYKQYRNVKWFIKGVKENIFAINDGKSMMPPAINRLPSVDLDKLIRYIPQDNISVRNRVFIIDEINRGNISKIFGELITLIEDSKRIGGVEELIVKLPYSKKPFGVPQNVYLLGTMNTADRSIALIDTALRRRFKFVEMQPNAELLKDVEVEGVKIKELLEMINKRIEVLYDREHTIGHSFFMGLSNASTIADLAEIFECNVIPLLKEYFYNDYERIAAVLGDDLNKNDVEVNFILRENDYVKIPNSEIEIPPAYIFNSAALKKPEAYEKIYK